MKIRKMKKSIRSFLKITFLLVVLFPISLGIFCFTITSCTQNFHVMIPNTVYRSAQPNGVFIKYLHTEYGLKSILNLRGKNDHAPWYQEERDTTKNLGIKLIDFPMSAHKELNSKEIEQLISILATAPKPLLIHCKAGADRTGLASSLYLNFIAKYPEKKARSQLSILYGHIFFLDTKAMDNTFEKSIRIYQHDYSLKYN
ncbi:dual specificity protein phosphatase family protein [Candidatus Liberibacter brunswickensis]|uniref:dual specificity protein phosphatase family protein n=1 Tax=Candidatus Liberibacter brunswickensis TaxID=1968796 RepID=UPI002FE2F316